MLRSLVGRNIGAVIAMMAVAAIDTRVEAVPVDAATGIEFSKPDRIRYDNRSLIIDGKPVFIFSGAMHYFRCPRELWKDRLQKLKDAGLNCVETYLAWDIHEPREPANPDDFSELRDMEQIGDFIQAARDLGLYVIIRPGPYICAEWDRGGLPGWLMRHRPEGVLPGQFLRGNSPPMLAWDRHWFTAAARVVKPHLITNVPKGSTGVILWQLENEYDWNYAGLTSEMRTDVLRALAHASLDNGIDVPLFTCETMDDAFRKDAFLRSHLVNTTNKYPGFEVDPLIEAIEKVARYQPEAFRGVTELQGGWFSSVGGQLAEDQGHNAAQISHITLTAIERGCTSINYYMFYGGSNFGYGAARTMAQSYDYNAPLREWGERQGRYLAVAAIGRMLAEHGDRLIHSDPVGVTVEGDHSGVSIYLRRSSDGSHFLFLRNSKKNESRSGKVNVHLEQGGPQFLQYDLGPFEAKILYVPSGDSDLSGGQWLPKPVLLPVRQIQPIPAAVPARITSIAREEPANNWRNLRPGKYLDSAGIFDQRYVYYRVNFELSAQDIDSSSILFVRSEGGGDSLSVRINGTEILPVTDGCIPLGRLARVGRNTAEILFENLGCPNFRPVIEDGQGITHISLVSEAARSRPVEGWRMKRVDTESPDCPEVQVECDDRGADWKAVALTDQAAGVPQGQSIVYRTTLELSKRRLDAGVQLTFGTIDDRGTLFVNGHQIGNTNDSSHESSFEITRYLHEGNNSIALLVHNDFGEGGLYKGCKIDPVGRLLEDIQVSGETSVDKPAMGNAMPPDQYRRLLVRYTLECSLPNAPSVPWKLHLEASANAFVTLNGHLLGRYWASGPQRDIWLPECWLNFGPGSKNVIELQARPTAQIPMSEVVKVAELRPYLNSTDPKDGAP